MTILSLVDYGLIVLFFFGVSGLVLLVANAPRVHEAPPQALPPPQKAKEVYAFLGLLFVLLIALTFVSRRDQPHPTS